MEIERSFHFVPAEFLILQAKIGAIFHPSITFCLNLEVMAFCIILFTALGWKMLQIQYQIRQTHLFIKPVRLMGYQFSKQFINSSILGWGRGVNGEASEGESVELWPRAAFMHEMRSCTVDVLILANVATGRKFSCCILERVCFSFPFSLTLYINYHFALFFQMVNWSIYRQESAYSCTLETVSECMLFVLASLYSESFPTLAVFLKNLCTF